MAKVKIHYEPLPTQAEVFDDDITENIMHAAGLGSGKTYNLCQKLLKLSRLNKNMDGGILAPDFPSFKKDIKPTFEAIFNANKLKKGRHWDYHQTDKYYSFSWTKGLLYVFSAEKEIAGPNLAYCGINEFSLCPWQRINEMIRRVRVKSDYKQRIFAGTPEDKYGWLQEYVDLMNKLSETEADKFKIVHGNTTENFHLDDDYAKTLEYLLDEQALKIFKEGKIVKISSNLFYYSFNKDKNVSDKIVRIPSQTIYANMDFNVGRMTTTFSVIKMGYTMISLMSLNCWVILIRLKQRRKLSNVMERST
jgi:hypothetical protein